MWYLGFLFIELVINVVCIVDKRCIIEKGNVEVSVGGVIGVGFFDVLVVFKGVFLGGEFRKWGK